MTLPSKNNVFITATLVWIVLSGMQTWAQTSNVSQEPSSCAQKLEQAQNLYEEGKIHLVEETISQCLEEGFTRDEKVAAYKLLSITYTYLEEDDRAEQAVLNLLKFDKEYDVNPDLDPTEFINLYEQYRTFPIFKIGIKGAVNYNFFDVTRTRTIFPNPEGDGGVFDSQAGFGGGIEAEIPYKDFLELVPGIYFTSRSHNYTLDLDLDETYGLLGTNSYLEQQRWIELPLLIRYKYMPWKVHPYTEAGFTLGYLFWNEKSALETSRTQGAQQDGPPLDFLESRNPLMYGLTAGAGIKFDIPMAEIVIGGRFNYALNDQVVINTDPTAQESELLFRYGVLEHNYRMHTVSLFIGYMFKVYKPKKLDE